MPRPISQKQGSPSDFQTPISAVKPLLPFLKKEWLIWECAMGNGNIVNYLTNCGYKIIGSDILYDHDFLTWQPEKFDCIITNPPYHIKQKFLERCYELDKPFVLLLPLTTFETRKRQKLFRDKGIEIFFLPERVRFETPSGRKEDESSPWFAVAWFCYKLNLPKQLYFYEEDNKHEELI